MEKSVADSVFDSFKSLVWDVVVKAALSKLFAAVPWLGWGPVGAIISGIAGLAGDSLYGMATEFFDLQAIKFKNDAHRRAFDMASVKLAILAREKGVGSPEFKQARDEQKKALSNFIKWSA